MVTCTRSDARILLKNLTYSLEWTEWCVANRIRYTVIRSCPSALRPHKVIFLIPVKHEWSFNITFGRYFLVNCAIGKRHHSGKITFQPDNIAMFPSAVNKVVRSITILEYKLIDWLRSVVKRIDQRMTEIIVKR